MATKTAPRARIKICVHHWIVHTPQGTTSWGTCRKCSKRKRFSNHFDGRDRTNNSDLFVDTSSAFKPDRRSTYYDSSVGAAYDESRRSGVIS
jgi:hypothetical protein